MWPGLRPTFAPSLILIHPTVWPQYTSVTWQCRHIGGPHMAVGCMFAVAGPSTWNSHYSLPKRLRDPSSSSAVFGRLLKTFLFSECVQCIRGFGDDALYKLTFYITLHYRQDRQTDRADNGPIARGKPFHKRSPKNIGSPYAIGPSLSVLSGSPVCDVGVLWPNGWMDQDTRTHQEMR